MGQENNSINSINSSHSSHSSLVCAKKSSEKFSVGDTIDRFSNEVYLSLSEMNSSQYFSIFNEVRCMFIDFQQFVKRLWLGKGGEVGGGRRVECLCK